MDTNILPILQEDDIVTDSENTIIENVHIPGNLNIKAGKTLNIKNLVISAYSEITLEAEEINIDGIKIIDPASNEADYEKEYILIHLYCVKSNINNAKGRVLLSYRESDVNVKNSDGVVKVDNIRVR